MEETIQFGEVSAHLFHPGEVYGFVGEMASGKTTFIKHLINNLQRKNKLRTVNQKNLQVLNKNQNQ